MYSKIEWISIKEKTPTVDFGWFLVAINPVNFKDCDSEGNNNWRESFGCTKVWWHGCKFWEQRILSSISEDVTDRVTHWANMPIVPLV